MNLKRESGMFGALKQTLGDLVARSHHQPIFRLILTGFLAVALVPLFIVAVQTYHIAWDNAWRTATQKHAELASRLSNDISAFHGRQVRSLNALANQLAGVEPVDDGNLYLQRAFKDLPGLVSLAVTDTHGAAHRVHHRIFGALDQTDFSRQPVLRAAIQARRPVTSSLHRSEFGGRPVITVAHPIVRYDGSIKGVIMAEIDVQAIRTIADDVQFGVTGHAAVVDAAGRVLAHPSSVWEDEMKDLSTLPVISGMNPGVFGVREFRSSYTGASMVAGYTVVPGLGWRVMTPQPKNEVEAEVNSLLYSHFLWASLGILFALLAALLITRWLTRPINQLASAANRLTDGDFKGTLPELPQPAPTEIEALGRSFRELVRGLQTSRDEFRQLNLSLEARVREATKDLKNANQRLERLAQIDDLTGLYNRRYFEQELCALIRGAAGHDTQHTLLYADLDRFKSINDHYGHQTGDDVLCRFAELLLSRVAPTDIVARMGGDEFTILMVGRSLADAVQVAAKIQRGIAALTIHPDHRSHATVSIGLARIEPHMTMSDAVRAADQGCYAAKSEGLNKLRVYKSGNQTTGRPADTPMHMT